MTQELAAASGQWLSRRLLRLVISLPIRCERELASLIRPARISRFFRRSFQHFPGRLPRDKSETSRRLPSRGSLGQVRVTTFSLYQSVNADKLAIITYKMWSGTAYLSLFIRTINWHAYCNRLNNQSDDPPMCVRECVTTALFIIGAPRYEAEQLLWSPVCVSVCPSVCPQENLRTRWWMSTKRGRRG